jgi:predicted amidohydrolase
MGRMFSLIPRLGHFRVLEHLRILALARAIENQCYLILANRVGTDDGVTFCGTSAIIDPYGVIVAAAFRRSAKN